MLSDATPGVQPQGPAPGGTEDMSPRRQELHIKAALRRRFRPDLTQHRHNWGMTRRLVTLKAIATRWLRDRTGNVALMTALAAPVLGLAVMAAVETSSVSAERALMQQAADAAALAAAMDQSVAGRGSSRDVQAYVRHVAMAQLGDYPQHARVNFTAQSIAGGQIRVDGTATRPSMFGNQIPAGGYRIQVSAIAETASQVPICVVTLAATGNNRFQMADTSRISATGCLVHSNRDIDLLGLAFLQADVIQATRAANGTGFAVPTNTGALRLRDPFEIIPMPSATGCPATIGTRTFSSGQTTLPAGVHCDHIIVQNAAQLTLGPGEHIFRGRLRVRQTATLRGTDVALFFMNTSTNAEFVNTATVDLTGRQSGIYAGFVMVMARGNPRGILIGSPNVNRVLGTVYAPNGWVRVSSSGQVAEDSDWSVVITNRLFLDGSPNLVINTRYTGSPVPVPGGVGHNLPTELRLVR